MFVNSTQMSTGMFGGTGEGVKKKRPVRMGDFLAGRGGKVKEI